MNSFDLDNAIHIIQQEIDDHSLWDQHIATQNDDFHAHGLNGGDDHGATNELSFDSFSHNGKEPELHYSHIADKPLSHMDEIQDYNDDGDFLDSTFEWVGAGIPKFASAVASVVVGEEVGELLDSDVAKFAAHYATGKIIDFVSDNHEDD